MDNSKERSIDINNAVNQIKQIIEQYELNLHELAIILAVLAGSSLINLKLNVIEEELIKYQQEHQVNFLEGYIKLIGNMIRSFIDKHKDHN